MKGPGLAGRTRTLLRSRENKEELCDAAKIPPWRKRISPGAPRSEQTREQSQPWSARTPWTCTAGAVRVRPERRLPRPFLAQSEA